jgi:putative spermidine/putrescine transport system permease protein
VKKARLIGKSFFYVCVFASCAPLAVLIFLSFSFSWPYPSLLPTVFTFQHYVHVFFNNPQTWNAISTSIILALFTTLLSLAIAIPAAKSLALYNFRGKELVKLMVLLPLIVPPLAVTFGIQVSMIRLGLTGNFLGVTIIHTVFALPFAIRIMTSVFDLIGDRYEKQATVLGASTLMTFFKVTLPIIMPGILSAAVLSFSVSIAQYITTLLIGGGRIITITVLLVPFFQSGQLQIMSVYSIVLVATSLMSLFVIERAVRRFYNLEAVVFA